MNKLLFFKFLLFLSAVLITGCGNDCPSNYIVGDVTTPPHVENYKENYDVDMLEFINDSGERLVFNKTIEVDNEIYKSKYRTVPCENDLNYEVTIEFERERSSYIYESENGDTIQISYYPTISTLIREFSEENVAEIDYIYRMKVDIVLPSYGTDLSFGGIAMWLEQSTIDAFSKLLGTPYTVGGITYDEVYYWSEEVFGDPQFLYIDGYNIVGFFDAQGNRWIRV